MRRTLTLQDRMRVAAEAVMDVRSVEAAYAGKPVRASTLARIQIAAHLLGLPAPGVDEDDTDDAPRAA